MSAPKIIGPFLEILSMQGLTSKGPLAQGSIPIIENQFILINQGKIEAVGKRKEILENFEKRDVQEIHVENSAIVLPGFVDCHTHICFAGSRSKDYAMRNSGKSYLEIASEGGGIWDTVRQTRQASEADLVHLTSERAERHLRNGITTIEVKSGYGLSIDEELKMLRAIKSANQKVKADLVPTCLAAHIKPKDFSGSHEAYLDLISSDLFPILKSEDLTSRIDAFIEEEAFSTEMTESYFRKAKDMGFDITVHADQFHVGGSQVAVSVNAMSADHLEASTEAEVQLLAKSEVVSVALPGASLGLGCAFTPARKILDAGGSLAIASDWNPGSGPMGDLITQAAILGTFQKLSNEEILAGITFRAALALGLKDRGRIEEGMKADLVIYETDHFNEILYHQGQLKPSMVIKNGETI